MESRRRITGDGQLLIEKIVRLRIRESRYWKEHCFGLTVERLIDKAVELTCVGGVASETNKPTPFLCLLLRMLALAPAYDIVVQFIRSAEFKYLRCLGAMYLRLVGLPEDIYEELEPLLADFRKVAMHTKSDWQLTTIDQFIEGLLSGETSCDIVLPRIPSRQQLFVMGKLGSRFRESALREEFMTLYEVSQEDEEKASKRARRS
jgi:pre-mRNA-splicing factor 38A